MATQCITAESLRSRRAEILAVARKRGARNVRIFGSVARGDAWPDSDVDILVELGEPTFDHYMDLKFYLEDVLGAPVDLVLADCVKPRLQPIIAQEVVYA